MNLESIASKFALPSALAAEHRLTAGLINTSHLLTCADGERFVLQSLNSNVFKSPAKVMENIAKILTHLNGPLQLIPTSLGKAWLLQEGTTYRCYPFLEDTQVFETISSPELAHRAAASFGSFQQKLSTLDAASLHVTIPDFHNTPAYLGKLETAVKHAEPIRLKAARSALTTISENSHLAPILIKSKLPMRITHNDTKISNILFSKNPAKEATVIDLDTTMPGLSLFDYGDLVRSAAASAAEDEADFSRVAIVPQLHEALREGYLSTASSFLNLAELELLDTAPKTITLELAVRFLTDYLLGDVYFQVTYPEQNLIRAQNQLQLLATL